MALKRGGVFLVRHPSGDTRRARPFVVVSRQVLLDSRYSTALCAPIYSQYNGLGTEVRVGTHEGLKHESSIHCDAVVSLRKETLTSFIGSLSGDKLVELNAALAEAVGLNDFID